MLNSLEIRNYRNLRHLTIEKLGRVNLLVGKNNTGKTSVLEAVYICVNNGNFDVLYDLLEARDGFFESSSDDRHERSKALLSSLFFNRISNGDDGVLKIKSNLGEGLIELTIKFGYFKAKNELRIISTEHFQSEVLRLLVSNSNDDIERIIPAEKFLRLKDDNFPDYTFPKSITSQFVKSNDIANTYIGNLFDEIVTTDQEDEVINALKIIDSRITKIAFRTDPLSKKRYPIARLKGNTNPIPLRSMGDGINRILAIILAMVNCDKGFLFIDEFENGLHYSVQEKLWEIIFYLAERLDIQVFATTHSLDCVEAFSSVLNNGKYADNSGAMIRLENYEGNIEATVYDADEIHATTRVQVDPR